MRRKKLTFTEDARSDDRVGIDIISVGSICLLLSHEDIRDGDGYHFVQLSLITK